MFAKLLKHEWRDSSRILTILSLAALGAGAVGALLLRMLSDNANMLSQEADTGWIPAVLSLMMLFAIFGLMAYALGTRFLLLYRFYKSKFTDEGYLAFTLPVNSRQIFLASFLNQLTWGFISGLVIFLAALMMVLIAASGEGVSVGSILEEAGEAYSMTEMPGGYMAISLLTGLVSVLAGHVTNLTCVVLGAVVAKKHKILAALGAYYAISMVTNILSTVTMSVLTLSVSNPKEAEGAMIASMAVQLVIQLVLAVGGFFLSTYLMEKKLNLP